MLPTPSTSHVSFERIYEPAEDSFLLLDTLSRESEKRFLQERFNTVNEGGSSSPVLIEIGTGSGVVLSFVIAHSETIFGRNDTFAIGVDINRYACVATEETVKVAQKEQVIQGKLHGVCLDSIFGDLTSCLRTESVDVLIFNPPYVPTPDLPIPDMSEGASDPSFEKDSQLLALSYAGGKDGMETSNRLLDDVPRILSKDRGCAYILLCAQNNPERIKQRIREWGAEWMVETVASSGKKAGWETLQIIRIWRSPQTSPIS